MTVFGEEYPSWRGDSEAVGVVGVVEENFNFPLWCWIEPPPSLRDTSRWEDISKSHCLLVRLFVLIIHTNISKCVDKVFLLCLDYRVLLTLIDS